MPRMPKRPCAWPGCPNLTDGRYCDVHAKRAEKVTDGFTREPDKHARYGRAWKKARDAYATAHPFCERCFEQGRMTPLDEVHHIVPVREGGGNEESNLMSLCRSCHNLIHAERGDRNAPRGR